MAITGAILAGGLGTRLRAVVSDRPKVLAMVRGKPFLAYLLDQLMEGGVRDVVLLTGYRGEQIRDVFGRRFRSIRLEYSQEETPLGTAGAIRLALPKIATDTVLMMNGDSYCAADMCRFQAFHRQHSADASLMLTHVPDTSRFGKVETGPDGRVLRFLEKQDAGGDGWINAGLYLLRRELIEEVPAGQAVSIEREMFPAWSRAGKLFGHPAGGSFLDIGTPESYVAAEEFFGRRAA